MVSWVRMSSGGSCSEIVELLETGMRCKEPRKEKELLRETQSQSFDLIKMLERHVSSLSEAHSEDRACIKLFEREERLLEVPSQSAPLHPLDVTHEEKMEEMSREIHDYELFVKQLKEELRQEKLKAKEEAEDMVQETAVLRYQMTELLEEECKRRASVEQLCLQRIVKLEAQEQRNSAVPLSIVTAQKV